MGIGSEERDRYSYGSIILEYIWQACIRRHIMMMISFLFFSHFDFLQPTCERYEVLYVADSPRCFCGRMAFLLPIMLQTNDFLHDMIFYCVKFV